MLHTAVLLSARVLRTALLSLGAALWMQASSALLQHKRLWTAAAWQCHTWMHAQT